jgi:ferritin-like metal-binding protein YciE
MENRIPMPKLDSLEPLMIEELRDLLDAEKQITRALPKMAKAATSGELKAAFEEHLEQTGQQIERLNEVFEHIGERPRSKKCVAMESIIDEGQGMLEEVEEGPTRDALLIAAAQKVEHYEMAAYGTARTFANILGHEEAAGLLEQTLEQEKMTDERLTEIAESVSNPRAAERDTGRRGQSGGRGRMISAADRSRSSGRGKSGAASSRQSPSSGRARAGSSRSSSGGRRGSR